MKIAIMQPYFMPYIGYFQLIKAVDKFVLYDDVNYIKQGWINRNRILVNGSDFLFTIPLAKASSFNFIADTYVNKKFYNNWKEKFLQTLNLNYKKAPFFEATISLVSNVLNTDVETISELAGESICSVTKYLGIDTKIIRSSSIYKNRDLDRKERLVDICSQEGATHYINAAGGQELYAKEDFAMEGVQLNFIKSLSIEYKQLGNDFVPWLSVIDVMMFNSVEEINLMLDKYELI